LRAISANSVCVDIANYVGASMLLASQMDVIRSKTRHFVAPV